MNPTALGIFAVLSCLYGPAFGHPVKYDQRQEGDLNVRTDVEDVVFVVVPPQDLVAAGMGLVAATAADFLRKNYGGVGPERWPQRTPPKLGFVAVEKSPYKIDLEKAGFQVKKIQQAGDPNRYNFHEGKNPTKSAPEIKVPSSTQIPEKGTTQVVTEATTQAQHTTENKTVKKDLTAEGTKKTPTEEKPSAATKKKPEAIKKKPGDKPEEAVEVIGGMKDDVDSIARHEGCGPDAFRDSTGICVYTKTETKSK